MARTSTTEGNGHDFGISTKAMFLSSFDFIKLLGDADIFACAYGEEPNTDLKTILPVISLVGTNEEALKKVFNEFESWGVKTDGDTIDVVFVILKQGGYLVGISSNLKRLEHRLRNFDRAFDPILSAASWIKKFDTTNPHLRQLKELKSRLLSPIAFSFAFHPPTENPSGLNPYKIRRVKGLDSILKFDLSITEEDEVTENSHEWMILECYRSDGSKKGQINSSPGGENNTKPNVIHQRRAEQLKRHFPVILASLNRSKQLQSYYNQLSQYNVRKWQLDQAICNIVLSAEICGEKHYETIPKPELADTITSSIRERIEDAISKDRISGITLAEIQHQICLDGQALLALDKSDSRSLDLQQLQERLHEKGFLSE